MDTVAPEAPPVEPTAPSAPTEAAQESSVTTIERGNVVTHEFRNPDAAPAKAAAPEAAKTEPEAATDATPAESKETAPPAERTESDDLTPEELKRFEKSKAAQARIQQLADNRAGNLVQREREKLRDQLRQEIADEQKAWQSADEAYQLLATRGREAFMAQYRFTEREAAKWEADYLEARETRGQATSTNRQADETFVQEFNSGAITEFRAALSSLLPFYGDLPDDAKRTIDGVKFDPEGNWLGDALGALAKGIAARDERIEREHKAALEEARTAGANRALAEREEAAPVIVDSRPNDLAAMSRQDIYAAFAANQIGRATYHAELRRRGIDY